MAKMESGFIYSLEKFRKEINMKTVDKKDANSFSQQVAKKPNAN